MEGSNYWGYGYKTQHSYPRSRLIIWKKPEVKFVRNVVKKKQHQNYEDEDKKSAINKKINSPTLFFERVEWVRKRDRDMNPRGGDLKDLDTAILTLILAMLCHTHSFTWHFFNKTFSICIGQEVATGPPAATLGLQNSRLQTEDWRLLTLTAVGFHTPLPRQAAALRDWRNLFWLQDWDWPLLFWYLCIYNFITPTHFRFNPCELLPRTHHCLPVYTGAFCNHFVYTAGTSGYYKGQYATQAVFLEMKSLSR